MIAPLRTRHVFALVLAAFTIATPALAQSDAGLARENAQLKSQVADLEKQLAASQRQITALTAEVKRLRTLQSTMSRPGANPGNAANANDPMSSHGAYIESLRSAYSDRFDEIDTNDKRARSVLIRQIRSWASGVRRDRQGEIEWPVQLDTREGDATGRTEALFRGIDGSGNPAGEPFIVRVRSADMRRLKQAPADTVWTLKGVLAPKISIAADRLSADDPGEGSYVGPFAQVELEIRVDDLQAK